VPSLIGGGAIAGFSGFGTSGDCAEAMERPADKNAPSHRDVFTDLFCAYFMNFSSVEFSP
jgi:hypothetical protein